MRSSGGIDSGIFVADETGIKHNSSQHSPPISNPGLDYEEFRKND